MRVDFIRWFAELDRTAIAQAGGKGANLGEMIGAGLPVPPGCVLLTDAYRAFVAAHHLQPAIERLAGQARADQVERVEAASVAIRALFEQGAIPPTVARAVTEAYVRLGRGRVAVRSSATAEDLPNASFAGQQESYLNVEGEGPLLDAVRRCWSSLWTGRAIAYRLRQGIAPADVALAVVIQRQVEAEAAGILFTVNPVNGRRDQMVIDAARGLGEAVVSGQVTPDRWVADGQSGSVLEEHLQGPPALDPGRVAALVALGRQVAAHFGSPQDIEWAWAAGRFYLVQSRPVTTLFPLPLPASGEGLRVMLSFNILQGLLEPFTPMGIALFRSVSRGFAGLLGYLPPPGRAPAAFKVAAGRIYLDATDGLRNRFTRPLILLAPSFLDQQTAGAFRALVEREGEALGVNERRFPIRTPWGTAFLILCRLLGAWLWPRFALRRGLAAAEALCLELEGAAARAGTLAERQRLLVERPGEMFLRLMPKLLPLIAGGQGPRHIAGALLERWLGDGSLIQPVLRSVPNNPTTEMDLALWRVSRRLKAEGAAVSADHPAVVAFLDRYGHRAVREIDVGMPRWTDDPTHVLDILRTFLTHGEEADAEAHFRRGAAEAERAAAELVARVRREKGWLRSRLLRFLLVRARLLVGVREFPKFTLVRITALWRRVLQQAGAELAAAGRLEQADDIFFLDLADLTATDRDLCALAAANRAEYQRELGRRAVPRVLTSLGESFYAAPAAPGGGLVGTCASAGVYEGRVRVIHDPKGARLEPGEVLVAPGTDPAWTPLFLSAGALVMEIGGVMSHGSVVAREYGIPAVVGVVGATQQLHTGQRVRVDGESGVVVVLEEA